MYVNLSHAWFLNYLVLVVAAVAAGLRVFDAAVGGLGGCPYTHTSLAV